MSYARCCDRCGNFMKVDEYTGGSPYVSIGIRVGNGTALKQTERMDLCPACATELNGWLHIYDEEGESNNDEG